MAAMLVRNAMKDNEIFLLKYHQHRRDVTCNKLTVRQSS